MAVLGVQKMSANEACRDDQDTKWDGQDGGSREDE
jgi:hypothetical protein